MLIFLQLIRASESRKRCKCIYRKNDWIPYKFSDILINVRCSLSVKEKKYVFDVLFGFFDRDRIISFNHHHLFFYFEGNYLVISVLWLSISQPLLHTGSWNRLFLFRFFFLKVSKTIQDWSLLLTSKLIISTNSKNVNYSMLMLVLCLYAQSKRNQNKNLALQQPPTTPFLEIERERKKNYYVFKVTS